MDFRRLQVESVERLRQESVSEKFREARGKINSEGDMGTGLAVAIKRFSSLERV